MDILIWVLLAVVFIIMELITASFFLVWLDIGSVVAAILNYLGFDIYIQFTAFVVVSAILILMTRKFANRITPKSTKKTTADRLIGKKAKIIRKIDDCNFVVRVSGEEWSAHTNDPVDVDDMVKIVGINSIILIIEKID